MMPFHSHHRLIASFGALEHKVKNAKTPGRDPGASVF
jgi:hypothetical protein